MTQLTCTRTIIFAAILLCLIPRAGLPDGHAEDGIRMISPVAEETVVSKKPLIRCRIDMPVDYSTLYLQLDYADVTVLAKVTETGFEFTPVQVLPPGSHTLVVSISDAVGRQYTKEFQFVTRHSRTFETAYSQNTVSGQYQQIIHKAGDAEQQAVSQFEAQANIGTQNLAAQGNWEVSFSSNARYLDQELPMAAPLDPGLELVDYQLRTRYQTDRFSAGLALGDISLTGTRYTYSSLARRGGSAEIEAGALNLTGFAVRSDQAYGLDGEWGLSLENDNHLHGGAGTLTLLDQRLAVTVAHVRGGELAGGSYGIWAADPSGVTGKASGLRIKTDFFDHKAQTVLELGWSDFDEDTGDTGGAVSDDAVYAEIGGVMDRFTYRASWEENGSDYRVPGNSSIVHDRRGGQVSAGYSFEYQTLSASASQYRNNLDKDPARAVIDTDDYRLDYSLSKFSAFPLSLNLGRSVQRSADEPSPWDEIHMVTDSFSGSLSYMKDAWSFSLCPGYSRQNDKTGYDSDTDNRFITLTAAYSAPACMVSGSFMLNESTYIPTGVDTLTYTYNLFFRWDVTGRVSLEGSGGLSQQAASDDSMDSDYWNGDIQLCYQPDAPLWGILSPKVLVRASYNGSKDRIYGFDTDGALIYLMLTGDLQWSF